MIGLGVEGYTGFMPRPEPVLKTSFAEYLELEARSQVRHEFVDGMHFAIAGGTDFHAIITLNIATLIKAAARAAWHRSPPASGCFAYMENMLVQTPHRLSSPSVPAGHYRCITSCEYTLLSE